MSNFELETLLSSDDRAALYGKRNDIRMHELKPFFRSARLYKVLLRINDALESEHLAHDDASSAYALLATNSDLVRQEILEHPRRLALYTSSVTDVARMVTKTKAVVDSVQRISDAIVSNNYGRVELSRFNIVDLAKLQESVPELRDIPDFAKQAKGAIEQSYVSGLDDASRLILGELEGSVRFRLFPGMLILLK